MQSEELNKFLADPSLVDLIERVKISDDVLDVIKLTENQHSDMLAWCLHPNEGHAQGDAVIKDFLNAAYDAAEGAAKFANKSFFEKWTPGKIRTSSFGAAFLAREFHLETDEKNKKRRLDLFLIDPTNRIVITIENKVGASLTANQLASYYEKVNDQIARRGVFQDYEFCFVVLDRDLYHYPEEHLKSLGTKWVLMDYSWLETSAARARLHLERNNEAAQLLMAYCQKQTGWQSPNEKKISELSAELAAKHEAVVNEIRPVRRQKPTEWTAKHFTGPAGELLMFVQQNRQLCDHLVQARGIGAVLVNLRRDLPDLNIGSLEQGRTWLRFATQDMEALMDDDLWPLYVNVYRETVGDDEASKFTVRLLWVKDHFNEDKCRPEELRAHFASTYPDLSRFESSSVRRLVLGTGLSATAAVKKTLEVTRAVEDLLKSAGANGIVF